MSSDAPFRPRTATRPRSRSREAGASDVADRSGGPAPDKAVEPEQLRGKAGADRRPGGENGRGSPPTELKRLDRGVLLMTGVLWAAEWGIVTSRAQATGIISGGGPALVRLSIAALGLGSTMMLYWLLRRQRIRAPFLFVVALLLCVPLSIVLGFLNELTWLYTTDYYQQAYHLPAAELLSQKPEIILHETIFTATTFIWVYTSWCALYVGSVVASELRDRETRLATAEAAAQEARLLALRVQLNPHFLFNTLNTLSGLIALDRKPAAETVLMNLSNLLRHSLSGTPDQLIPLTEEIAIQAIYLEIESIRFADRLAIDIETPPRCARALVPPLLLQPLIENAIKHGVACSARKVTLTVRAHREADSLRIVIANSAPSEAPRAGAAGFGIGLSNVRKRLAALYGERAQLESVAAAEGGWTNVIRLPWLEQAQDARAHS